MSFDKWWNEGEGYSMRSERAYAELGAGIKKWVEAAYNQVWKDRQKLDAEIAKKKYTDKCSTHYQMASLGIAQSIREKD